MQRYVPLLLVLALFALFFRMMTQEDRNPNEIKSVMIGRSVPDFSLPGLLEGEATLDSSFFKTGQPMMINFFASWCAPCRAEHENLMTLAETKGITLIGIAYKDEPKASRAFLDELGSPYRRTATDRDGRLGIDFGVTGVPETFVIDGAGVIRYRHWGPIVGDSINTKLLPAWEAVQ